MRYFIFQMLLIKFLFYQVFHLCNSRSRTGIKCNTASALARFEPISTILAARRSRDPAYIESPPSYECFPATP